MSGYEKKNEDLFKDLFKNRGLEKAPEGFADRVMFAIEAEAIPETQSPWSYSVWWLWVSILAGVAGLVFIVFFIDFSFMGSIFSGIELDGLRITGLVSSMGNGFRNMYDSLSVSSLSYTILGAIVALFLIDRLIRRKPKIEVHLI